MKAIAVVKFGGSLVDFAGTNMRPIIERISELKQNKDLGPIAVFSAPKGVTNELLAIGNARALGQSYDLDSIFASYSQLASRHVKEDLAIEFQSEIDRNRREVEETLSRVFRRFDGPAKAKVLTSAGELLTAGLMNYILRSNNLNSDCLKKTYWPIITDDNFENATPDFESSRRHLSQLLSFLEDGKVISVAGFLGISHDGLETLLGRGGSDQTTVFLSCLMRDHYDVETILLKDTPVQSADPAIVRDQELQKIPVMTYNEASKATISGMTIIQNAAVRLARSCNLPIKVASLHDIKHETIVQADDPNPQIVKCITGRKNCAIITMNNERSRSLEDCLRLWEGYEGFLDLGVEVIDESRVIRDFLVLDANFVKRHEEQLKAFDKEMKVEYGLGMVTLVGDKMKSSSGVASVAIRSIPNINIKRGVFAPHTSQIILVLDEEDVPDAIRGIHYQLNKITNT